MSRSTSASELRVGEEIEIRTRCSRVGTKSLELEHEIRGGDRLAAEAKSVLVGYDYELGQSVVLPDELAARLGSSEIPVDGSDARGRAAGG